MPREERYVGLIKQLNLPWQRCNIVWLQWKTNVVAVATLRGFHGNMVWLLW
jgi:hypothetical protein